MDTNNNNNYNYREKSYSRRSIKKFNVLNSTKSMPRIDLLNDENGIEESSDGKKSEFSDDEMNKGLINTQHKMLPFHKEINAS